MAEQDVVHAARCNWRADLHEYAAAGHESFGDATTAAGKRNEASNLRREADLATRFVAAKEAGDADMADVLAGELREHRRQWREARSDPARGVPTLSIVNNFSEPSATELLAGGKAK